MNWLFLMEPDGPVDRSYESEHDTRWGVADPWYASDDVGPILLGTRYDQVGRVIATISILPGRVIETTVEPEGRTADEAGRAALEAIRELIAAGRPSRSDT